jgi:hypothetical protein
MTSATVKGMCRAGFTPSRVWLVDQNVPALVAASSNLSDDSNPSAIITLATDFRRFTVPTQVAGTTLALGSAAFHELGAEARTALFRRLSMAVRGLWLIELSHNNDSVDLDVLERVIDVARFYDRIIADAYASLRPDQYWPVVGAFLLGEFIQLISSDYGGRGNFHLTSDEWAGCLKESGFDVVAREASTLGHLRTGYLLAVPQGHARHL